MTLNRRTFLTGALAALAAPAIIRTPGLLMPVRPLRLAAVQPIEPALNGVITPAMISEHMALIMRSAFFGVSDLPHWRDMKTLSRRST